MRTPSILFRTDSSLDIGSGHVMRCLTLAHLLSQRGYRTVFLCRADAGHLGNVIRSRGHELHMLLNPGGAAENQDNDVPHAGWLSVPWDIDRQQSAHIIDRILPEWVVVDHYALDRKWHSALRNGCRRIMVIDDLADRRHDADVLLDQNFGRSAEDYDNLVPPDCVRLIGPEFALLREEFAEARCAALARRQYGRMRHILVTLGGVDKHNITTRILKVLARDRPPGLDLITVVLGASSPWIEDVKAQATKMPLPTGVVVNAPNMAQLMAEADLCIGAAGSTAWERCSLGLPTIMVVLAENQVQTAAALEQAGAASVVPLNTLESELTHRIVALCKDGMLSSMARIAAGLVDARGCGRAAAHMLSG